MARYSDAQNRATQKYIKANYDDIRIRVPKGARDIYKVYAEMSGKSLNQFIVDLLDTEVKKMDRSLTYGEVEEMEDTSGLYVVFEEDDEKHPKSYDLCRGIYTSKEAAIRARDYFSSRTKEDVFVAIYDEYIGGNYNPF